MTGTREFVKWLREEKEIYLCRPTWDCDDHWTDLSEEHVETLVQEFEAQST